MFICYHFYMGPAPNMQDYAREYRSFSLRVPEQFSFPLDVFDTWGDRPALYWTDGVVEKQFSFDDLRILSSKGAGAFRAMGIRSGDRVLILLPNVPEWWETMLALLRLNAIPVPATTLLTAKDIEYRFATGRIRAVIASEEDAVRVEEAASATHEQPLLIIIGKRRGWMEYTAARKKASPFPGERTSAHAPALIYFTSGTTGPPKMVLHTQASYPLAHLITGRFWLDLRPGDLHWNLSDTGWAKAAWSSLFGPWHMGAAVFSFFRKGKFDPSSVIETLGKYPVTTLCGPPTAYRMMAKETADAGSLAFRAARHFVAAGEPLNSEVIAIWQEKTGLPIYDGYGQTETVNVLANFRCLPLRPGSMGRPVPGFTVDVIGDDGRTLPAGTEGDIAVRIWPERPVGLFSEYLGDTKATEKTVRGEWYVTGDRAVRDAEGYFWFIGRADDIILTSGYRIGPFEIESILIEHPAVKESAVVASPDETRGEVVKAFVVLTKGYLPSSRLAEELQAFVKERTAPYKYPRRMEFVEDLPKTPSGKIRRKELKAREFRRAGP